MSSPEKKKVTVILPEDLLSRAMEASGTGTTGTIVRGLQLLAASEAYKTLHGMKGKLQLKLDLKELRQDR